MPDDAGALRVFFLDVGNGDCTFVVPPEDEGAPILVDCNDSYVAERFVANHGITVLAAVVASHLDIDHVRGLLPFLKTHFDAGRRIEKLVMFPDRAPKKGRNKSLVNLVRAAAAWEKEPPHSGFALKANHRDGDGPLLLTSGSDWSVELVLPWVGTASGALTAAGNESNLCSAVLRVTRGETNLLIGGDAPLGSWERLEPEFRHAKVIRVPHHGGEIREHGDHWTRFDDLYAAVDAELAVLSVGTANGHEHPRPDHVTAAHREFECRVLCTQLTPRCHDDPLLLREEALASASGVEWPYRQRAVPGHPKTRKAKEVPCAGSVIVWIGSDGHLDVEPAPDEAHDMLLGKVDHPMCRPTD